MRKFLFLCFLISFQIKAEPFTDEYLKAHLNEVIEKAHAIVEKAGQKGNQYAPVMLKMLTSSKIYLSTDDEPALAEYLPKTRKIRIFTARPDHVNFDRDFMINQYYPAVLVHEAAHDIIPRHDKQFAHICTSVFKDANVPFVLGGGWAKGFDFRDAKYLDFQVTLAKRNRPYVVSTPEENLSEVALRQGVIFSYLNNKFTAGGNVVLKIKNLKHLHYNARTNEVSFEGKVTSIDPYYNGLPLDVIMKAGDKLVAGNAITFKANRDSFIRVFHVNRNGKFMGVNAIEWFPAAVDASFTITYPGGTLSDAAGAYANANFRDFLYVVLETNKARNQIPFSQHLLEVKRVRGTLIFNDGRITCNRPTEAGEEDPYACTLVSGTGKKYEIENSKSATEIE